MSVCCLRLSTPGSLSFISFLGVRHTQRKPKGKNKEYRVQTAVLRSELHSYIDALPKRSLLTLKPLLSVLSEPLYTIETDLTDEENAIIDAGMKEYREHPENFISLDDYLTEEVKA
jgi:hypothetical protein